jgi:uncharacterized protein (DUF2267 family)
MRQEEWISEIRRRWGAQLEDDAERLLEAVLSALREQLDPLDARALAAALPAAFATPLARAIHGAPLDGHAFRSRVAALAALPLPAAIEGTQVVLGVLAESIPDELLVRLRKHVHPDLAELLSPPPDAPEPPEVHERSAAFEPPRSSRPTLATGRPGSVHPVSESRPDRAHAHSVARSDAPHADTKVSSSRGMTQEREHESLATGRPPAPRKPLSG